MTYREDFTLPAELLERVSKQGFDILPELIQVIIKDEFVCPAHQRLHFQYASRYTTENGYVTDRRNYECDQCGQCPLKVQCTRAKGNRKIRISFRLLEYRRQARANLTSEAGQHLRAERSIEVETVFGIVKHNTGIRRFHLRGLEKVRTEWGLVTIAHYMKKMAVM